MPPQGDHVSVNVQGLRYIERLGDLRSVGGEPAGEGDGSLNRGTLFGPADSDNGVGVGQEIDGGGMGTQGREAARRKPPDRAGPLSGSLGRKRCRGHRSDRSAAVPSMTWYP